jgi:hypothetical protein
LNCTHNKLTDLDYLPTSIQQLWYYMNNYTYDFTPNLENIKKYNASRNLSR